MAPRTFQDFEADLDRAVAAWPDGLSACEALVRELAVSSALRDRIVQELNALVAEPTHALVHRATTNHWVLWRSPRDRGACLTLSRVPVGPRDDADYLTDSAAHQIFAACSVEGLEADLYEQRGAIDAEVMSAECELTPSGRVRVERGDALVLEPRRDVIDVLPPEAPRYVLVFDGPRAYTQRWVYDKRTRRAVSAIVADPHDGRLEGGMRLLRVLGHEAAAPVVAALASHEAHFVRWTAIRYTMALDAGEGRRLLEQAVNDPHPHVRRAATRALERLDEAERRAR